MRFEVRPRPAVVKLSSGQAVSEVIFVLGEQKHTYRNGPTEVWTLVWPDGNNAARITIRGWGGLREEIAADVKANTEYLIGVSYKWGSPEWLEMRKRLMAQDDRKASTTRKQRGLYKTLKNTGLQWFF